MPGPSPVPPKSPPRSTASLPEVALMRVKEGEAPRLMQTEGEAQITRPGLGRHPHSLTRPSAGDPRPNQLGADPVKQAWTVYVHPVSHRDGDRTTKELEEAQARHFTESLDRFLDAADFLRVSTSHRFRCLGISRRTYFYWVRAIKEGEVLYYHYHIDYRLWLVWKSLELARLKLQSDELVRSWFLSPNKLLSNPGARAIGSGLKPIDLLFGYDIRRRPRILRLLLDMPAHIG